MKSTKILCLITILVITSVAVSFYNWNVSGFTLPQQNAPMFVLQSSESDIISESFTGALAAISSDIDKNIYLSQVDTQNVTLIDGQRKTKIKSIPINSSKALAINSQRRIFAANDSELAVYDAEGRWINKFSISRTTTSLAALNTGEVVVAAADSDSLLTVFDESGNVIRKIGKLKQLDKRNIVQNRFLNAGRVTANQSGDIYYVSMFSPAPTVKKLSKQGELLKEFAIEGAAVELQLKRAKEFLQEKKMDCTGGYYVIRTAAVDPKTGHLWIGMNGQSEKNTIRAESGVLYEYNSEGKKLSEYALSITSLTGEKNILTDIQEIAVVSPYVYVLTSAGKVVRFNVEQRFPVTPKRENMRREGSIISFIRTKWNSFVAPTKDEAVCPMAISYTCSYPCPSGSSPQSADCGTELTSRLNQGEVVISGSCSAGNNIGSYGGCSGSITGCASNDVRVTYSTSINCNAAPTPTPTTSGGGEYGECDTSGLAEQCSYNEADYCACQQVAGIWEEQFCRCWAESPVIIDVQGNGFYLTNAAEGVSFDMHGDGTPENLAWTTAGSDDAFLILDRNGNGRIDNGTELFGNFTPQPTSPNKNGFLALAEYDKPANGGNDDGVIDSKDSIFSSLRLWQDTNHNGNSEANELHLLNSLDIARLELDYKESKRKDEHGNQFRYRAKVWDANKAKVGRWAWDVFLRKAQ